MVDGRQGSFPTKIYMHKVSLVNLGLPADSFNLSDYQYDINLTILNCNGNLLGATLPIQPKDGKIKVMQY